RVVTRARTFGHVAVWLPPAVRVTFSPAPAPEFYPLSLHDALPISRQDRQVHPRDPLALRSLALLLEAVGLDAVVTVDVHNIAAFQNAFRCQALNLQSGPELARKAIEIGIGDPVVIVSPDLGGAKRAQGFGEALKR